MMKPSIAVLSVAATALFSAAPAYAQVDRTGDIQVKGFLTGVLPDGEITDVEVDAIGVPAGSQTNVTDSVVPTLAISYFLSDNLSIETICCVTPHEVEGAGALEGTELIDDIILLPATVTAKFHPDFGSSFRPYVGAGLAYFFFFGEEAGPDAVALGATDASLSNELGFALQAGFDIPLNDSGWGLSVDAKRYFIDTTATFSAGDTTALQTEHKLDPWVVGAGVSYTF